MTAATSGNADAPPTLTPSGRYAAGELLVKFEGGPDGYAAALGNASVGSEVQSNFRACGWQQVKLPPGMTIRQGLEAYQALETVLAVEPNYTRKFCAVPTDPRFKDQWALSQIGATRAWDITTGSTNVVVAVICTGVDYTHEDLTANMWRNPGETGWDADGHNKAANGLDDDVDGYVDDLYGIDACNQDADPMDDNGHDTGTAGVIGAVGNNGQGIAGLNWNVQIMALKSHNNLGWAYDSAVIECFEYVIMMKKRGVNIRITNNSYGGDEDGQAVKDAIDAAGNLGILNVFAAMNDGQDMDVTPRYPACFDSPSILAVAATDPSDSLVVAGGWSSNYGRKSVDLAAPGVGISTLTLRNGYTTWSGTSFATPHVAGAAALLLAAEPNLSVADLKSALLGTVDFPSGLTNKVASNGRLNIARALQFLVEPGAPPIVTSALPSGNRTPLTARVEVTFAKPMDRAGVEAGFSLTPSVGGAFEWSNNDRTVAFIPANPLSVATTYAGRLLGSAKDTTGVTLDGNYNRAAQGPDLDDFTWSFRTTPANDDFAAAETINGASGRIVGTNRNATREPGEPVHARNGGGASIWYRWMPPGGGSVTFDTAGTPFDTVLAVYEGEKLDALSEVASNDDDGIIKTSRLTFVPAAETTYFIALDGKVFQDFYQDAPPMDTTVLNWYPTPPAFRAALPFTPAAGVWSAQVTIFGTNFTGVTSVLFDGIRAQFTNQSDLLITATVPAGASQGPITIQTRHGSITSLIEFAAQPVVLYTVSPSESALLVDWAANGFVLEYTESLATPEWRLVTLAPTTVDGGTRTVVALPLEGLSKFYRWRKD